MINPIELALKNIYHTIPQEILKAAFQPEQQRRSLDCCIHEDVIVDRILAICHVFAGKRKQIVLREDMVERATTPEPFLYLQSDAYCIYRIPKSQLEGKRLITAINISYPFNFFGSSGYYPPYAGNVGGNTAEVLVGAVLESQTLANTPVLPTPHVLNGNMILLEPVAISLQHTVDWVLTCRLSYDESFTNMHDAAILPFVELTTCAVKIYIHNKLVLPIDKAALIGGMEHGRFREIVDSYAGEQERFQDLLKEFRGASTFLDPKALQSILPLMM